MVGVSSGPEPPAGDRGLTGTRGTDPRLVVSGTGYQASYSGGPVHPPTQVRLLGVALRLLKASEDNFDDLFRELQMADIAAVRGAAGLDGAIGTHRDAAQAALRRLVQLAETTRPRLTDLRVQARQAIWEASRRGDRLVDLDLRVDSGIPVVFSLVEELVLGAWAASRHGYLLTEPPGSEVVAWRQWARKEIVAQIAGGPATTCPFPIAIEESPSAK